MWWALASFVASLIISVVTAPKSVGPPKPLFEDMQVPQIEDGTPQSVVFGEVWIVDWMVLGMGNFRTTQVKSKGGKK